MTERERAGLGEFDRACKETNMDALREAIEWARDMSASSGRHPVARTYLSALAEAAEKYLEQQPEPEIKCPFCGNPVVAGQFNGTRGPWYWTCNHCKAMGPSCETEIKAIESARGLKR